MRRIKDWGPIIDSLSGETDGDNRCKLTQNNSARGRQMASKATFSSFVDTLQEAFYGAWVTLVHTILTTVYNRDDA